MALQFDAPTPLQYFASLVAEDEGFALVEAAICVAQDEQPFKARIDKIPTLRPAFGVDGTVTAANASSISDGAAALVLIEWIVDHRRRRTCGD
mgnify:CR=1 FL=1